MVKFSNVSFFIPSGKDLEQAAQTALKNIDKQLAQRPVVKKTVNTVDFSWLYNDASQFKPHIIGNSGNSGNKLHTIV